MHVFLLLFGDFKTSFDEFAEFLKNKYNFQITKLPDFEYTEDLESVKNKSIQIINNSVPILNDLKHESDSFHVIYPIYFETQRKCFENRVNSNLVKINVPTRTRFLNLQRSHPTLQSLEYFMAFSDKISQTVDLQILDEERTEYNFHFRDIPEMQNKILEHPRLERLLQGFHNLSKPIYFMRLAYIVKKRSNCMKRAIGAIVIKNHRILSMGYNGTPYGMKNCYDDGCPRCNRSAKQGVDLDECFCLHAEQSAILEIGLFQSQGADIYVTAFPCQDCAKIILQAVFLKGNKKCVLFGRL